MANSGQILNAIRIVQCKEKISSKVSPTVHISFLSFRRDSYYRWADTTEPFEVVMLLLIANKCDAIAKLSSKRQEK